MDSSGFLPVAKQCVSVKDRNLTWRIHKLAETDRK